MNLIIDTFVNKQIRAKHRWLWVIALGVILIVFIAYVAIGQAGKQSKEVASDFQKEKNKLREMFQEKGGKSTYEYFKTNEDYKNKNSHELAHFVGMELYVREGESGVAICDEAYNWGCYHGFFGQALSKEGNKFLTKAESACRAGGTRGVDFGGCVHGVGHGVMALHGYTPENLPKALADCDLMTAETAKGCYNGVFMEYNTRIMQFLKEGEGAQRILVSENPYEPCLDLEERYQYDCFHEQPNWWSPLMQHDFSKMGYLCGAIPGITLEEACYRGIGRVVPGVVNYDKELVGEACMKLPTSQGIASCMRDAIEILLNQKVNDAEVLCLELEPNLQEVCRAQAEEYRCRALSHCKGKE